MSQATVAIDTAILVYAHREETPYHKDALKLLRGYAEGPSPWAMPWLGFYEFLQYVTHPKIFKPPTPVMTAWRAIESLVQSPFLTLLRETDRHAAVLNELLRTSKAPGNIFHDAHIAALLIEHNIREIVTTDESFARYPQLKVTNPFA